MSRSGGPARSANDPLRLALALKRPEVPSMSLTTPTVDPTPIFELFRGSYATELLTAAVAHFDVFSRLAAQPMTAIDLGRALNLAERPTVVLVTALRAFNLLTTDAQG